MESVEGAGDWQFPPLHVDVRGLFRVPILPVVYETQGCCWWGVPLNGMDDPPVAVCSGDQGDQWDYFASSFSDFVFARVFDMSCFHRCESKRTVIMDEDLTVEQLRVLRQTFHPEATTRQQGGELFVHRFSGEGQWFSVTFGGRDTRYAGSSEWQLMASDNDQFQALVQRLRTVVRRMDGVEPGKTPLYLRGQVTAAEHEKHCSEFPF